MRYKVDMESVAEIGRGCTFLFKREFVGCEAFAVHEPLHEREEFIKRYLGGVWSDGHKVTTRGGCDTQFFTDIFVHGHELDTKDHVGFCCGHLGRHQRGTECIVIKRRARQPMLSHNFIYLPVDSCRRRIKIHGM